VKKISLLFLSVLLLLVTACSDRKEKKTVPVQTRAEHGSIKEENRSEKNESNFTNPDTVSPNTTVLKSIKNETYTIVADAGDFSIDDIEQPILLVNIFSTWCPTCRGQIPYFEDLQKKYGKSLFIAGILINDDSNNSTLESFYEKYHINYFVSNSSGNTFVTAQITEF